MGSFHRAVHKRLLNPAAREMYCHDKPWHQSPRCSGMQAPPRSLTQPKAPPRATPCALRLQLPSQTPATRAGTWCAAPRPSLSACTHFCTFTAAATPARALQLAEHLCSLCAHRAITSNCNDAHGRGRRLRYLTPSDCRSPGTGAAAGLQACCEGQQCDLVCFGAPKAQGTKPRAVLPAHPIDPPRRASRAEPRTTG